MKPPEFQYFARFPIRHHPEDENVEVWIDDSVGWQSVPEPGNYDRSRELVYDGKTDLDSIAKLEAHVIGRDHRKEDRYVRCLGNVCFGHDPVRATAMERLRALARVIGGEA